MKKIILFAIITSLAFISCKKEDIKQNVHTVLTLAATGATVEICQAEDTAAVQKDMGELLSKSLNLPKSATGTEKSIMGTICKTTMNLLILQHLPELMVTPPAWKAKVDCIGGLKEKLVNKTCNSLD